MSHSWLSSHVGLFFISWELRGHLTGFIAVIISYNAQSVHLIGRNIIQHPISAIRFFQVISNIIFLLKVHLEIIGMDKHLWVFTCYSADYTRQASERKYATSPSTSSNKMTDGIGYMHVLQ